MGEQIRRMAVERVEVRHGDVQHRKVWLRRFQRTEQLQTIADLGNDAHVWPLTNAYRIPARAVSW